MFAANDGDNTMTTRRIVIGVVLLCSMFIVGSLALSKADEGYPNLKVQFVNSQVGWIVGPRLLQTTDGGRSWKQVRRDGYGTFEAETIGFGDRIIQFVSPEVGLQLDLTSIVKTTDGGKTWPHKLAIPALGPTDSPSGSIFFLDRDVGWVVDQTVHHTTDGGRNWAILSATPTGVEERQRNLRVAPALANFLPALWFVDNQTGFMARLDGEVYRTTDGGKTWIKVLSVDSQITGIYFVDKQNGWLCGGDGLVARTTDGGATWSTTVKPTTTHLIGIFFINREKGWVVGSGSTILYTSDGGTSWKKSTVSGVLGSPPLASVSFVDELHGWAVGGNGEGMPFSPLSPSNVIVATDDGGHTWRRVAL
jgi:photosystem II stability/assembly factor-like uncharacterized protein